VAMADDPWTKLKNLPCKHLRSKEMFYDNGIPLEDRSGSGIFWCAHTHNCLGPDGTVAARDQCGPSERASSSNPREPTRGPAYNHFAM